MQTETTKAQRRGPRSRTKGVDPAAKRSDGRQANLYYSYIEKADGDVVLSSQPRQLCALSLVADPTVRSFKTGRTTVDFAGRHDAYTFEVDVASESKSVFVDVRGVDAPKTGPAASKAVENDEARRGLAEAIGASYRCVTPKDLSTVPADALFRCVASMAAVRDHSLGATEDWLIDLLARREFWTLREIFDRVSPPARPVTEGALVRLATQGRISSDFLRKGIGPFTWFWSVDRPPPEKRKCDDDELDDAEETSPRSAPHPLEDAATQLAAWQQAQVALQTAAGHSSLLATCAIGVSRRREACNPSSVPPSFLDVQKWPTIDIEALSDSDQAWAKRLRAAIAGYVRGESLIQLSESQGIPSQEICRQFNRAMSVGDDGRIVGWRVLQKGYRTKSYKRLAPVTPNGVGCTGFAGAMGRFFAQHPEIEVALRDYIQGRTLRSAASRVNGAMAHEEFKRLCKAATPPIGLFDYPFNTKDKGRRAIRRFVKEVRDTDSYRSAQLYVGNAAAKRLKLESGHDSLLQFKLPYSFVEMDSHEVDCQFVVRIPHPSGDTLAIAERMEVTCIVEGVSGAVLGYRASLGSTTASDAAQAVKHALSTWKPMKMPGCALAYPRGGGLPSGVIPELSGAAWSLLKMDNGAAFTSKQMAMGVRQRVGCTVNWGGVGNWIERRLVEGTFRNLEVLGFHRIRNTTGHGPQDVRRKPAAKFALAKEIDINVLLFCLDVSIAELNATAQPRLAGRSSLEFLREVVHDERSGFVPRYLPPLLPAQADLDVTVETPKVRGSLRPGTARACGVEIDGSMYTSTAFSKRFDLVGKRIRVHIRADDMRLIEAYDEHGQPLGPLQASKGWRKVKHTRAMRKLINKLIDERSLKRFEDEDWTTAFMRHLTEGVLGSHKKGSTKTSKAATKLAKAARDSDTEISTLLTPPLGPQPTAAKKPPAVPSFINPVLTRVTY